jgi:Ni,Fe-hydrogenase I small subunit
LPAISFDAYHCPELRWGAALNSAEGRSCHSTAEKNYWYSQQQLLRNQLERRFDVRMNYRADELSTPRLGVGVTSVPETDIPGYLSTL